MLIFLLRFYKYIETIFLNYFRNLLITDNMSKSLYFFSFVALVVVLRNYSIFIHLSSLLPLWLKGFLVMQSCINLTSIESPVETSPYLLALLTCFTIVLYKVATI